MRGWGKTYETTFDEYVCFFTDKNERERERERMRLDVGIYIVMNTDSSTPNLIHSFIFFLDRTSIIAGQVIYYPHHHCDRKKNTIIVKYSCVLSIISDYKLVEQLIIIHQQYFIKELFTVIIENR